MNNEMSNLIRTWELRLKELEDSYEDPTGQDPLSITSDMLKDCLRELKAVVSNDHDDQLVESVVRDSMFITLQPNGNVKASRDNRFIDKPQNAVAIEDAKGVGYLWFGESNDRSMLFSEGPNGMVLGTDTQIVLSLLIGNLAQMENQMLQNMGKVKPSRITLTDS